MKHRIYSFPLMAKGKQVHKLVHRGSTVSPANRSQTLG